jgi:hypothetical protein
VQAITDKAAAKAKAGDLGHRLSFSPASGTYRKLVMLLQIVKTLDDPHAQLTSAARRA